VQNQEGRFRNTTNEMAASTHPHRNLDNPKETERQKAPSNNTVARDGEVSRLGVGELGSSQCVSFVIFALNLADLTRNMR
jgi:hypothetical protein